MKSFKFYKQQNEYDCGPTCLRMVAAYYGRKTSSMRIMGNLQHSKQGYSFKQLIAASENIGLKARGVECSYQQLIDHCNYPCILHWKKKHYVVLVNQSKFLKRRFKIADPANGLQKVSKEKILENWAVVGDKMGYVLVLEPTKEILSEDEADRDKITWKLLLDYIRVNTKGIYTVLLALTLSACLQLLFPFLTQSIVDNGINTKDISYITIVLAAQFMLLFSKTVVDFIRTRILLNISVVVNLSLLSEYWLKITKLPMKYFDRNPIGDVIQRIRDHLQIQTFLTGTVLNTLFSVLTFTIFTLVLLIYDARIWGVFALGSLLYFIWIRRFLKIRAQLNLQLFLVSSKENNATVQLVQGMHEIKLKNAENQKRAQWEEIQISKFSLSKKSLTYNQIQQAGAILINQSKDLGITFIVANLVINGNLSFGAMLAIQYILGQLNGPIEQFVNFMQSAQDAKLSMERINEIHLLPNEERTDIASITQLPKNHSIKIKNLSFAYDTGNFNYALRNITTSIQQGKFTAIVGLSGSGKTTLLKLLLKFYEIDDGEITIGEINLKSIKHSYWRTLCGSVLQDGFIFNGTIAENISIAEHDFSFDRLVESCRVANILEFIESLPKGFYTQLGTDGISLSQGQKQRILIARAVYDNPPFLFLDEATNSLDSFNEKIISENLKSFFEGKTVVVIAHRLSTVKAADHIIVLDAGSIIEEGTHHTLTTQKGKYFQLVKDQLELTD